MGLLPGLKFTFPQIVDILVNQLEQNERKAYPESSFMRWRATLIQENGHLKGLKNPSSITQNTWTACVQLSSAASNDNIKARHKSAETDKAADLLLLLLLRLNS